MRGDYSRNFPGHSRADRLWPSRAGLVRKAYDPFESPKPLMMNTFVHEVFEKKPTMMNPLRTASEKNPAPHKECSRPSLSISRSLTAQCQLSKPDKTAPQKLRSPSRESVGQEPSDTIWWKGYRGSVCCEMELTL